MSEATDCGPDLHFLVSYHDPVVTDAPGSLHLLPLGLSGRAFGCRRLSRDSDTCGTAGISGARLMPSPVPAWSHLAPV